MGVPAIALTINLWGHLSGGFGLGEGARCTARALEAAGLRVQWRDLPLATHVNDQPVPAAAEPEPAAIDLLHTNPNVLRQTDGLMERLELTAPLRIGYWAWELEAFPSGWEFGFAGLDQLWCPSMFTPMMFRPPMAFCRWAAPVKKFPAEPMNRPSIQRPERSPSA